MNQLLLFIENFSIDEKLYWQVPLKDQTGSIEITWERMAQPMAWKVRPSGQGEWSANDTRGLEEQLHAAAVDMEHFERQLGVSVLTQAVFADMVMERASELFGRDVVKRSIADTRAFLNLVSETATQLSSSRGTLSNNAPSQRQTRQPKLTKRSQLKLIRPTREQ